MYPINNLNVFALFSSDRSGGCDSAHKNSPEKKKAWALNDGATRVKVAQAAGLVLAVGMAMYGFCRGGLIGSAGADSIENLLSNAKRYLASNEMRPDGIKIMIQLAQDKSAHDRIHQMLNKLIDEHPADLDVLAEADFWIDKLQLQGINSLKQGYPPLQAIFLRRIAALKDNFG